MTVDHTIIVHCLIVATTFVYMLWVTVNIRVALTELIEIQRKIIRAKSELLDFRQTVNFGVYDPKTRSYITQNASLGGIENAGSWGYHGAVDMVKCVSVCDPYEYLIVVLPESGRGW